MIPDGHARWCERDLREVDPLGRGRVLAAVVLPVVPRVSSPCSRRGPMSLTEILKMEKMMGKIKLMGKTGETTTERSRTREGGRSTIYLRSRQTSNMCFCGDRQAIRDPSVMAAYCGVQ